MNQPTYSFNQQGDLEQYIDGELRATVPAAYIAEFKSFWPDAPDAQAAAPADPAPAAPLDPAAAPADPAPIV